MIPVLFAASATSFSSNGLGRLPDAVECTVTEERNGPYELYMRYPITGAHYSDIAISRIIYATPADGKTAQPFRIYRMEKPLDGIVSIYAEHISYQLNHIPVMPFTAESCAEALTGMVAYSVQTNPFSVWTDKAVTGNFTLDRPEEFRALLGGIQGSILDVYGKGEYEFDGYAVKLYVNRGVDSGVVLRYGKNITELKQDETIESTITGVCPYWQDAQTGTIVTLPEYAVWSDTADSYPYKRTAVIDFSAEFEERPTVAQLRARANKYMTDNDIGLPKISLDVEFVPLWQMEGVSIGNPTRTLVLPATVDGDILEGLSGTVSGDTVTLADAYWDITYADYRVLERIHLCDTVTIRYDALGVDATAKVVKTVYNVLTDRYDSLEIGDARTSLAEQIAGLDETVSEKLSGEVSALQKYVNHQTELITGGLGGYVVLNYNADGQPEEILIMDTDDMATAVHVIRMNQNGIGFSSSGYSGPYTSAWTIDGVFNADFIGAGRIDANLITVGTMLADRILGGTLKLGGSGNGNGVLQIVDDDDNVIGTIDNTGATLTGNIMLSNGDVEAFTGATQYPYYDAVAGVWRWRAATGFSIRRYDSGELTTQRLYENNEEYCYTSKTGYRRRAIANASEIGAGADMSSAYMLSEGLGNLSNYSSTYDIIYSLNITNFGATSFRRGGSIDITSGGNLYWNDSLVQTASSSSRRYKHDIGELGAELDPHKLLELPVVQFAYNNGALLQYRDMAGKTLPGLIAEDVAEIYPSAVIHNEAGEIESWDERRILPGMLALIQEQQKRLEEQEARIARLEKRIEEMTTNGK